MTQLTSQDPVNVLFFLYHLWREDPYQMWGGIKIEDAFSSALKLIVGPNATIDFFVEKCGEF